MTHTFLISPKGTIHTLYTEIIPLHELGTLRIRRASHVEFNAHCQQWEVRTPNRQRILFHHRSRSRCLQWETSHLSPLPANPPPHVHPQRP